MSKKIRVENADGGREKVTVELWGEDCRGDVQLKCLLCLSEPTDMIELELFDKQFLVIKGE